MSKITTSKVFKIKLMFSLLILFIAFSSINTNADGNITILRLSDAISPGELFTIYGENLYRETIKVEARKISDENVSQVPPVDSLPVEIVNGDREGHFVTLVLPKNAAPGSYAVWLGNGNGFVAPVLLNVSRPQWLSQNAAAPGQKVRIIGRNLDGKEFGAQTLTSVRLCYNDQKTIANVSEVNPFSVEFYMPNDVVANRIYTVEITSDGVIWKSPEWVNTLTAKAAFADVFNLGVWWAGELKTTKIFDVTSYSTTTKAIPNDTKDDAKAIQLCIDAAYKAGGGIVYLPEGNYRSSSTLWISDGVILKGAGMDKTTLTCTYTTSTAGYMGGFIRTDKTDGLVGRMGVTGMKLNIDTTLAYTIPDSVINIGTAGKIFITDCDIDMPFAWQESTQKRGISIYSSIKSDALIRGNKISGCQGMVYGFGGDFITAENNEFVTMSGHIQLVGIYNIIENNIVTIRHDIPELELVTFATLSEGAVVRGPVYIADNIITGTGRELDRNDGEIILSENAGAKTKMYGQIVSATANSVLVNPVNAYNWDITDPDWNAWTICIIDGKGMGQYRKITAMSEATSTIDVAVPWDIIPDSTSKFNVLLPSVGNTFYNNKAYNTAKGYWFYNDTIDGVMYGNSGVNTEGAFVNTYNVKRNITDPLLKDYRLTISYFDRLENNSFSGVSTRSNVCGIGSRVSTETSDGLIYAYQQYGFEIKKNTIDGANTNPTGGTEAPDINGIYVVNYNTSKPANRYSAKGIIIEDNLVTNSNRGITVGGGGYPLYNDSNSKSAPAITGVSIKGNKFVNVASPYNKTISGDDISFVEDNGVYDENSGVLYKEKSDGTYEKVDKLTVGTFKFIANFGVISSRIKNVSMFSVLYKGDMMFDLSVSKKTLIPGIKQMYSKEFQYSQDNYLNNIRTKFFILDDNLIPIFISKLFVR